MPQSPEPSPVSFQRQFHQRWRELNDPHVRALAWLLDAPDLLDPQAPQWRGQIASLAAGAGRNEAGWLLELDRAPAALHAYLNMQPFARLGRYAEKLMAFYFEHQGILVAHGLQVRADRNDTVGEFDFLLRRGSELVHWEFATKFYLLQPQQECAANAIQADYFVGPNLADTFGAKMDKILHRQLSLGQHPAARFHLPQPLASAQALIKGWLFYHRDGMPRTLLSGVSEAHCRGFWCSMAEFNASSAELYAVLPRLSWLAPARVDAAQTLPGPALKTLLASRFESDRMPVLVALLERQGELALETSRGFIVPDDWQNRAGERIRRTLS